MHFPQYFQPFKALINGMSFLSSDLPRRTQPTSFHEFSMVQPTRSPNTRLVFMARNLSSMEALGGDSMDLGSFFGPLFGPFLALFNYDWNYKNYR